LTEINKRSRPHGDQKQDPGLEGDPARRRGRYGLYKTNYVRRRVAVIVALLLCVCLVLFLAGNVLMGAGEIRSGVSIGEVDVGGKTPEEARAAVDRYTSENFQEISFTNTDLALTGEDLGIKMNTESAVERAYAVGHEGWIGRRLSETVRANLNGYQVGSELSYDRNAARNAIEELAESYRRVPQNATFRISEGGKVEIQEGQEGRVLDQEQTLANLDRALSDLRDEVPVAEGPAPQPEVTTQQIENLAPTEMIGEYQTDFRWDSNPNRKENMRLAAGAMNNTTLKPGEVFSFNERAAGLDYKEAKTFSDGGVGFANGGGLCQVSSTLYMAAQYAGLEIVERHPHYAVLPYIKPGFDATVWFGDEYGYGVQDMKFKNTTDGYIVIREFVDDKGFLTAQIYGRPTGLKVEMRTEKIFEDTTRGIKWTTYKKVTNEDGEVIRDGFLYTYRYSYNPPAPEGVPHYETSTPRVSGWNDPGNTTGWAEVPE
jgi:vancomycin resistance protein YoaR